MVSGTDEHGTPVMVAADREGKSYVEVADYYNASFREDFRRLGLSYDLFSRRRRSITSGSPGSVPDALRARRDHRARDARLVLADDRAHAADRYIEGTCPICGYPGGARRPVRQLRQPARPDRSDRSPLEIDGSARVPGDEALLPRSAAVRRPPAEWIDAHDDWRPNVKNFSLGLLDEIRPRPITRDLDWGVRIPSRLRRGRGQAHLRLVRRRDRLSLGLRSSGPAPRRRPTPGASGGRTPTPSTTTSRARTTSSSTR